jgi:hypothetical protein
VTCVGLPESHRDYTKIQLAIASLALEAGDYGPGFPAYDRWTNERPRRRSRDILPLPRWEGSPLDGRKLFLHAFLDGFGDTFRFIRYVPLVREANPGARIVLACADTMAHLLAECEGLDGVIALPETWAIPVKALEGFVQAPLMCLPSIMGTTLETVPNVVPYNDSADDEEAGALDHGGVSGPGCQTQPNAAIMPSSSGDTWPLRIASSSTMQPNRKRPRSGGSVPASNSRDQASNSATSSGRG